MDDADGEYTGVRMAMRWSADEVECWWCLMMVPVESEMSDDGWRCWCFAERDVE